MFLIMVLLGVVEVDVSKLLEVVDVLDVVLSLKLLNMYFFIIYIF